MNIVPQSSASGKFTYYPISKYMHIYPSDQVVYITNTSNSMKHSKSISIFIIYTSKKNMF